jgi:DNA-binding MarR family transcriptional regulator
MTDIFSDFPNDDDIKPAMTLLFFAYRDFVSDPDKVLDAYHIRGSNPNGNSTLGRAHHRVIHFVSTNPGVTVAQLLGILQITKQSLARVLRQLVDEGFIAQIKGQEDGRQRHLYLTDKGVGFELALSSTQKERFRKAFAKMGPEAAAQFREMLLALVDEGERDRALSTIRSENEAGTDAGD